MSKIVDLTMGFEMVGAVPIVVMKPRNGGIAELVEQCRAGKIPFSGPGSLCEKVSSMGYSTVGLFEMVR